MHKTKRFLLALLICAAGLPLAPALADDGDQGDAPILARSSWG